MTVLSETREFADRCAGLNAGIAANGRLLVERWQSAQGLYQRLHRADRVLQRVLEDCDLLLERVEAGVDAAPQLLVGVEGVEDPGQPVDGFDSGLCELLRLTVGEQLVEIRARLSHARSLIGERDPVKPAEVSL